MNDVRCIVYTSFATKSITEQSLKNLLVEARLFNEQQGVTGVLLHHNGAFFSTLKAVLALMKVCFGCTIKSSRVRIIIISMSYSTPPSSEKTSLDGRWHQPVSPKPVYCH